MAAAPTQSVGGKKNTKGKKGSFRIGPYNGWVVVGAVAAAIAVGLYLRRRSSGSSATDPTGGASTQPSTDPGSSGSGGGSAGGGTTTDSTGLDNLASALNDLTSVLGANGGILSGATGDPFAGIDPGGPMQPYGGPAYPLQPQSIDWWLGPGAGDTTTLTPTGNHQHHHVDTQKIPPAHIHHRRPGGGHPGGRGGKGGGHGPSTAHLGTAPRFRRRTVLLPKQTAGGSSTHPGRQL